MPVRTILVADPGIDTAFAVALALADPQIDCVGLIATGGNVTPQQATLNCHILLEQMDPVKWPRVGAALPISFAGDGSDMHGPGGLGGCEFPCALPHQQTPGDRLIVELVRQYPHEITVVCAGPATALAAALDREPDLARLLDRVILVGGAVGVPGDAGAVGEFHFACDPPAVRKVLRSGVSVTVVPLDVSAKLVLSPTDLTDLAFEGTRTVPLLRQITPFGIRACSNAHGIEGVFLNDVAGVVALAQPALMTFRPVNMDIETAGELTRGMSVLDDRAEKRGDANAWLASGVDTPRARDYARRILGRAT